MKEKLKIRKGIHYPIVKLATEQEIDAKIKELNPYLIKEFNYCIYSGTPYTEAILNMLDLLIKKNYELTEQLELLKKEKRNENK